MVSLEEAINNSNQSLERKKPIENRRLLLKQSIINSLKKDLDSFENKNVFFALSGGIDSSLLLAIVKAHFPNYNYVGLSIGSSEDHPDIIYSSFVCDFYQIPHIKGIIKEPYESILPKLNEINKELNTEERKKRRRGDGLSLFLLYDFISKHTKKVISGDGADELFGGYSVHSDPKRNKRFFFEPKNDLENNLIEKALDYEEKPCEDNIQAVMDYCWSIIASDYLFYTKIFSENIGVKVFLPYMDNRVISASRYIPIKELVKGKKRKIILRELGKDYLPKEIIERRLKLGIPQIINPKVDTKF